VVLGGIVDLALGASGRNKTTMSQVFEPLPSGHLRQPWPLLAEPDQ
jgi:hypothetical protein